MAETYIFLFLTYFFIEKHILVKLLGNVWIVSSVYGPFIISKTSELIGVSLYQHKPVKIKIKVSSLTQIGYKLEIRWRL